MSTPIVPPRPARNQGGPSPVGGDTPLVPPRPTRKTDPSPDRDAFTRSPLNSPPVALGSGKLPTVSGRSSQDLPRRPPSVSLPSIGQEGSEYSSYDQLPAGAHGFAEPSSADQTSSVSADLPMHQPRASLPQSTAKRQIQTVTRTDSTQAAAVGIGKATSTDDLHAGVSNEIGSPMSRTTSYTQSHHHHHHPYGGRRAPSTERHPLRAQSSFNRSTSSLTPLERTTSRPSSVYGDDYELGIPAIGKQIPLNPMAGDVQAPSPASTQSQHAPGIGFFNDGSARAQTRRKGSRQEFGPPDSYGIRHDYERQDQFEKAWAAKHPEEAAKEGQYRHLPKPPSALSSDQLNQLVGLTNAETDNSRSGVGTPNDEMAFEASNQYITRMASPKASNPSAAADTLKLPSIGASDSTLSPRQAAASSAGAQATETNDHRVASSTRNLNKAIGVGEDDGKKDSGFPGFQEVGWVNEHGDNAPILASDEVLKRPSSAYMHAAVTHDYSDDHYESDHGHHSRRSSVQPASRPSSRPSSVHGGIHGNALHRFVSHEEQHPSGTHTPLEEIEEYEPLFPENDKEGEKPRTFKKRPELALHHFPSQDVWEDTPASLQYSTTVSTPDLERRQESLEADTVAATFETPEKEQKRRSQNPDDMTSDKKTFVKPHFKPGVLEDFHHDRPGMQRFPSSDIWEDTPDSMHLETTVDSPQMDDAMSAPEERPTTTAIDRDDDDQEGYETRASTGMTGLMRPHLPNRPERKSKLDQELTPDSIDNDDARAKDVPDLGASTRPKPSVPARPSRAVRSEQATDENSAAPVPKAKPAVPARPGGEKIAAMKAGFMNDLNNRLRLGPQAPPPKKEAEPEVEEETQKAPLADARKSRARGPARRKPGAPPVTELKSSSFAMSPLITVWSIDEEDELQVEREKLEEKRPSTQETEQVLAANEHVNTEEPTFAAPRDIKSTAGAEGDIPDPSISAAVAKEQQTIAPELQKSLDNAEPAPQSFEAREEADLASQTAQPEVSVTASSGDQE